MSSQPGSELPSVEADVYVWRYGLLVVHARKEEEECNGIIAWPVRVVAKYCDEHTCLSVCPPGYLWNHVRDLYQFCCVCCLWSWLDPPPASDKIPRGPGSFGGFLPHCQCIVTCLLRKGSFDR